MINKISQTAIDNINKNSVMSLPDEPSKVGITTESLKKMFVAPVTATSNSLVKEVNRIVEDINAEFDTKLSDVKKNMDARLKPSLTHAILTVYDWNNKFQSIEVPGVTEANIVWISPVPNSVLDYNKSKVYCVSQNFNSLTFTCVDVPVVDVEVNIIIGDFV